MSGLTQTNITGPIRLFVAVLMGVACLVLIIASLAATGAFGASGSTALVSTGTNVNAAIPTIGVMLGVALVYFAMDSRRGR